MCGIAGYISDAAQPLPHYEIASLVTAMQAALAHRGPDYQDIFESSSGRAAICHTRLAIIDLSTKANQPMLSDDGRYVISFNGEIYNHKKLRERLTGKGVKFKSKSDTEVVLKLLIEEGPDALKLLRGMFALVLWDEAEQSLLAARDPLGIKPLYYCAKGDNLAFASEVRALLKSKLSSQKLSSRGLQQYLLRGSFSEPDTPFTDIKLLPAGTYFQWQKGKPKLRAYWSLNFPYESINSSRAIEITRMAFEHSIRAHLVSDIPVGIFLSGGIDSTAILAMASQLNRKPVKTYSIAFENPQWNEAHIAKRTAEHFGAEHTEWLIDAKTATELFSEFLNHVDLPSIDGFNTFCIAKLASQHGEKVVLSGLGGDELFGGYPSFEQIPSLHKKANRLKWFSFLIAPFQSLLEKRLSPKQKRGLDMLMHADHLAPIYQAFRGVFSINEANQLAEELSNKHSVAKYPKLRAHKQLDQISELEISLYCRNQLLRDADVFSMCFGLELRVPFIDKVFVEQVAQIPADIRLQAGKKLLIESVPEIPEWVLQQSKRGFQFPFEQWFQEKLKSMPIPQIEKSIMLTPWYRRWSLAVLHDWLQRYAK